MTKVSLRHTMNHRDFLVCSEAATRGVLWKTLFLKILQISQESTIVGVSFYNVASLQACNFIKKSLQHWCFPVKYANICRTIILKNICERLFLFALVTLEEVKPRQSANRSIFLNVTILFNQMQPYHFYIS